MAGSGHSHSTGLFRLFPNSFSELEIFAICVENHENFEGKIISLKKKITESPIWRTG